MHQLNQVWVSIPMAHRLDWETAPTDLCVQTQLHQVGTQGQKMMWLMLCEQTVLAITELQTGDETLWQDEAILLTLIYMQDCKQSQLSLLGKTKDVM